MRFYNKLLQGFPHFYVIQLIYIQYRTKHKNRGWFSGQGIGPIHNIDEIVDSFMYRDILEDVMLPYAEKRG